MADDCVVEITTIIDRRGFDAFSVRLLALSFLVVLIDGFDITVAGFAIPELTHAWRIENPSVFGPMLAASLVGILFGAPLMGVVGDRFGRKVAIVVSYVIFGIFTLCGAWAGSVVQMIILRLLGGVGIGGLLPNIVALNAEFAPKRLRATAVIVSFTGVAFGGALPGPVAAFLVPHYGWPLLFYLGGLVPLMFAVVVFALLPESIRFLAIKDRQAEIAQLIKRLAPDEHFPISTRFVVCEEKQVPFTYLFSGQLAIMTPLLWLLFALNLMTYFFLVSWMPALLAGAHIPVAQAALATAMLQVGGVIGSWTIAVPTDRHGMLPITALFILGIPIIGAIGYVGLQSPVWLMIVVFLAGFCTLGVQMGINAMSAIFYPTALRATGSGWAFGIGRVGSILGPIIGGLLIGRLSVPQLYTAAAVPFAIGAVASFILMRVRAEQGRRAGETDA